MKPVTLPPSTSADELPRSRTHCHKKDYRPPTLTDYGTLLELTLASTGGFSADRIGPRPNRVSR